MFSDNILILAVVLKQKLARRTKRPEGAKLSDKTRRAKVRKKHNANRSKCVLQHGPKCDYVDSRLAFKLKVEAVINGHLIMRGNKSS